MMNKLVLVIFSFICLALLCLKLVANVAVDSTAVLLLTLAGLPWIFPYLKGLKLPGGFEFEFKEQIQDVKRLVEAVKNDVKEQVEDLVSEPEEQPIAVVTEDRHDVVASPPPPLEPKEITVLKALLDSRFAMRTFSGIAMDTRLSTDEVRELLGELQSRGLAQIVQRPRGPRAVITAQGKQALTSVPR